MSRKVYIVGQRKYALFDNLYQKLGCKISKNRLQQMIQMKDLWATALSPATRLEGKKKRRPDECE